MKINKKTFLGFEIVTPFKTDRSFNHEPIDRKATKRHRRSLNDEISRKTYKVVHYRVRGLGQSFLFDLRPNTQLLSPNFYVKRMDKNGSRIIEGNGWDCHYHGRLVSHGDRPVAMTTCNGLVSNQECFLHLF